MRPEAGSDIKQETIGDRGMIDHFFPFFLLSIDVTWLVTYLSY
ncbi:hypothetical protein CISIN_1g047979mg [Citrus sinensis]|uniref:Uncharacterized protein n=1 Tax=Citrus sinensis TaxID=2711 RepID=A0A067FJQ0_CITSI|nr:hypothetical protein CISIN_1g047979mg [Citrus sinensis]